MNNDIKRVVDFCNIDEKRNKLQESRQIIFNNERQMSHLTFNRTVGLYAYNLDKYLSLLELYYIELDENKKEKYKKELDELLLKLESLENNENVKKYIDLRLENESLRKCVDDYCKSINIRLRNRLMDLDVPEIYVKSGNAHYTHIIMNDEIIRDEKSSEIVIYPYYELSSNRDYRHFYNRISFHYLEELSKDCEFSVREKSLGKIKYRMF